jgi:type IV pilus assembly protein PilQ
VNEETISSAPAGEFGTSADPVYTGRRISLDFKNADIHDVLRILADVSGLNIVATDDVKARVTLRLVEVPWDQALDVVLQANGLEKTQVGNVVTISTTRRLEAERNARLAAKTAQQKLAPLETVYVKVNYVKATDVVALITREIQQRTAGTGGPSPSAPAPARAPSPGSPTAGRGGITQVALMSPRGTIAADPTTNVVVIHDVRENIEAIRELIRMIDVQTPQVVIESYIVTANENIIRDLGVQWGYSFKAGPATGNPTGVNFPGTIGLGGASPPLNQGTKGIPFIADFPSSATAGSGSAIDLLLGSIDGSQALNLRLTALETEGKARVISRPRVVTLNNKVADIRSRRVVRVPVVSGNVVVGGAGTTGGSNAFQEFDVGITLKVTPQISSDGFVLLDIDAESSELTDASVRPTGAGSAFPLIPDELRRTASSNILIREGETFVLGGILQDNLSQQERGVPFLRDTPGIGWLFRGRRNSRVKDELLVFITPKLAPGASTAGLPTAQQLWEHRPREAAPPEIAQP